MMGIWISMRIWKGNAWLRGRGPGGEGDESASFLWRREGWGDWLLYIMRIFYFVLG